MARPVNTHDMIVKYVGAFATILDEIDIVNGHGEVQRIPLVYSSKEKWLDYIREKPDMQQSNFAYVLPRMGMELTGINLAPERNTSKMVQISDPEGRFIYNRVAYDFSMSVYIGATRMVELTRIIEQIAPYFTPGFTIAIKDVEELNLETNVSIVLNSTSITAEYEGSFDQERVLMGEMQFTVKGYLYQAISVRNRIHTAIMNMRKKDFESIYERITQKVIPEDATIDDPHVIVETVEINPEGDPDEP